MAMMFGRFEILSELSKGGATSVYKATDTETNQSVALKTLSLESLGDRTPEFVDMLIAEGERTRELSSQNLALLYGAGEIEGQFCAAMEYVQGNSVATMLSRKEGFSIWDILDVTRQVCAGLDHAASLGVVHHSLEPAKVMVQWDGLVKILGYGISSMSLIGQESGQGLGRLLPYCSPEQVEGGALDVRSNLFTWGAVLYEMVTTRRAFDAEDSAALENQILNEMPPSPAQLNPKIHAGVSTLIMKALAKKPEERYQSGRELAADLEKCKEGGAKSAATPAKKAASAAKLAVSPEARAAAASKFVSSARPTAEPARPQPAPRTVAPPRVAPDTKFAVAAAGVGTGAGPNQSFEVDPGARLIDEPEIRHSAQASSGPVLSAAVAEPETEPRTRTVAVDPAMSAPAPEVSGRSFSDIEELPPMAAFVPPSPSQDEPIPEADEPIPLAQLHRKEEKPKIQPREVAEKALLEIRTVPPQLMIYSILAAVALILIVAVALYFHVRSQDDDSTAAPRPIAKATSPAPEAASAPDASPAAVPESMQEAQPEVTVRQLDKRKANSARKMAPAAPVVVPGQIQIDSNPEGAQIQLDGDTDPTWITPFILTGLRPGQHTVAVSKSGYSADTRLVDIAAGSKSFVSLHLSPVNALVVVNSTPAGADVILDGKSTGRVTPVQFAVEKGSHTVLLRKQGYLEETTKADLGPGQNFQFAPVLRALGNTDDIRTVGKFKKLFGNGGDSVAGMGSVAFRTQPKGAQIAVNRRLLDKLSPVEVMLGPGNYVVDITLTGFQPLHKVISVEKGGKVAVDETLVRE